MFLKYISYVLFLFLIFSIQSCNMRSEKENSTNSENNETINNLEGENNDISKNTGILFFKNFYSQYFEINLKKSSVATRKESEKLILKSITDRLRQEMFIEDDESMGEGYFWIIKSQDFFEDWLNTLNVY